MLNDYYIHMHGYPVFHFQIEIKQETFSLFYFSFEHGNVAANSNLQALKRRWPDEAWHAAIVKICDSFYETNTIPLERCHLKLSTAL